MKLSSLTMLMYELYVKACALMIVTKYVWGYGASHIHYTSRLRVGLWVRDYNALMCSEVRLVQLDVTYCNMLILLA